MADFDITSLLANSGKTNANFDFSQLADSYYKGLDEQNKNAARDAFRDGVPTGPDGQPDFGAMSKKMFEVGNVEQGVKLSDLAVQRQGQAQAAIIAKRIGAVSGPDVDGVPTNSFPPSINGSRTAPAKVAPSTTSGNDPNDPSSGTTIMQVAAAQGIPNDQLGAASDTIGAALGIDPQAKITLNNPVFRQSLIDEITKIKRAGVGNVYTPGQATPAPQVVGSVPPQGPQGVPLPPVRPAMPPPQPAPVAPPQAVPVTPPQAQVVSPQPDPTQQPIVPRSVQTQTFTRPQGANPQEDQGTFGPQTALPTRGAPPTGTDPETQRQISVWTQVLATPNLPKDLYDAAKLNLDALNKRADPTGAMKEYDLYRRQGGALPFDQWQVRNELTKAAATKQAEADVKEQSDIIEAGRSGAARLGTLNTLTGILRSDPNINLGFGSSTILKTKMALEALGVPMPDLSGPQAVQKLNAALAVEMAKSLTSRTTQFEFKTFLANNPGLALDRQGNERLIGIFSQLAKRDVDLGKLARANRNNWENWDTVVENYDRKNPVRDPVTKRVLSNDSVIAPAPGDIPPTGPVKSAAPATPAPATPPGPTGAQQQKMEKDLSAVDPRLRAGARPAPDGNGYMLPNPDPNADKTKNPYIRYIP